VSVVAAVAVVVSVLAVVDDSGGPGGSPAVA
jgi:hypothetical protein